MNAGYILSVLMVVISVYGILWSSNHLDEQNAGLCLYSSSMGCLIGVLLFFVTVSGAIQ